jgi:hypothetical protein
MLGTNGAEEEDWVKINADGTENTSHEPWILLGRRDRKVAAFVEETGANDDSQPHAVESRHETATAQPPAAERLRADVAALAALCGRPRGPTQRNGRVVSPPGSAKKKRRQRKLKPFAGRPRNASRMRQLYP